MPMGGFWARAQGATAARAEAEGWTDSDCFAAQLQSSFLSYTSSSRSPDVYGNRYSSTCPEHAVHNAPWNDWVPPSKSGVLFQRAQVGRAPDRVQQRVRVRLCSSADAKGLERSVIAFASVDDCYPSGKSLCLRRGASILASLTLDCLQIAHAGGRFVQLAPRGPADVKIFLWFDTDARMLKFRKKIAA